MDYKDPFAFFNKAATDMFVSFSKFKDMHSNKSNFIDNHKNNIESLIELNQKAMDLYNNEGGIEVCSTCNPLTNPTNLVKGYVLSLLNEGKLVHIWPLNNDQTIRPDSNIYPTNQH